MPENIWEKIAHAKKSIKKIDTRWSRMDDILNKNTKEQLKKALNDALSVLNTTLHNIQDELEKMLLDKNFDEDIYDTFSKEYKKLKKQYNDLAEWDFALTKKLKYGKNEKKAVEWITKMYQQEGYDQLLKAFFEADPPQILDNSEGKSTDHIDNLNTVEVALFWNNFYNAYKQSPQGFKEYIHNETKQNISNYHRLLQKLEKNFKKTKVVLKLDKADVYYGYFTNDRLLVSSNARNTAREKIPPSYESNENSPTNQGEPPQHNLLNGGAPMPQQQRKEREQFIDFKSFEDCQNSCAFTNAPEGSGFDKIIFKKEWNKLVGYPIVIGTSQDDLIKQAKDHERARKSVGQVAKEWVQGAIDFTAKLTNNLVLVAANVRTIVPPKEWADVNVTNGNGE